MKDKFVALIKSVKYSPFPGGSPDVRVELQLPEHAFTLIADALIANGATMPVFCKDCKDYEPHGNGKAGVCQNKKCKGLRYATDYCSYGEPKERER
jgi:hypothetical protein